jgi:carbon-monoxide dehydrogenase large subunit
MPYVAQFACAPYRPLVAAADPDLGLWRRQWFRGRVVERPVRIAQALWEYGVYDENGQLATASLMDYAVPKADFFPSLEVERTETPTDVNPLGVRGAGETGTIASTAAVVNAVMDALAPLGIRHLDMPLTPERVWRAMEQAKG